MSGRHFFGVTMFASSRFLSATDIREAAPDFGRTLAHSGGAKLKWRSAARRPLNFTEDAHLKSMSTCATESIFREGGFCLCCRASIEWLLTGIGPTRYH